MTELLSLVTFPVLMGLTVVSKAFILTFFGHKWLGAVPILQIMAIVGILRVLMNTNGAIILAKGKANIAFYWDTGVLILYGISLFFAVGFNRLDVVAWTYVLVSLVNFFIGRWLLTWLIELRLRAYVRTIALPLGLSLIMTCAAFLINESCSHYFQEKAVWTLFISVSVSAALYVVLLKWKYPTFFLQLRKGAKG